MLKISPKKLIVKGQLACKVTTLSGVLLCLLPFCFFSSDDECFLIKKKQKDPPILLPETLWTFLSKVPKWCYTDRAYQLMRKKKIYHHSEIENERQCISGTRFSSFCLSAKCLWHGNRQPNYWFTNDSTWVKRAVRILWRKNPCWLFTSRESLFGLEAYTCLFFLFSTWCFSGGLFGHSQRLWRHLHYQVLHICQGEAAQQVSDMLYWLHPCKEKAELYVSREVSPTLCPLHFSCLDNRTPLAVSVSEIIVTLCQRWD